MTRTTTLLALAAFAGAALAPQVLPAQSYTADNPFPSLNFTNPVFVEFAPGLPGRLFVLEKAGRVRTFLRTDAAPTATTYLDIASRTATSSEQGLLGIAFDPNFASNGKFYVHYNWNGTSPGTTRVSRFTANPPTSLTVNAASEEVLFSATQPDTNHKGGTLTFGTDGLLYLFLGDGGGAGDVANNSQNLASPLGKVLRFDVNGVPDAPKAYRVPPSNPFISNPLALPEIYAYGLRNPYRASTDWATGAIIIGDVGQGDFEEINLLTSGANYGWRLKEGFACYNPSTGCGSILGLTDPLVVYDHSQGQSITGGLVARGAGAPPALRGSYVYGDYVAGRIWATQINLTNGTATPPTIVINSAGFNISSFGTDETGNVWITQYGSSGRIRKLTQVGAPVAAVGNDWQIYE